MAYASVLFMATTLGSKTPDLLATLWRSLVQGRKTKPSKLQFYLSSELLHPSHCQLVNLSTLGDMAEIYSSHICRAFIIKTGIFYTPDIEYFDIYTRGHFFGFSRSIRWLCDLIVFDYVLEEESTRLLSRSSMTSNVGFAHSQTALSFPINAMPKPKHQANADYLLMHRLNLHVASSRSFT
jgi:hypothetical protein